MYAPGIPDKYNKPPQRFIEKSEVWQRAVQKHDALRAGTHYDLRIVDPKTGEAHSWALRNLPASPGMKVLAVQQPVHTAEYATWSGKIESGYGAGHVRLFSDDKIDVIKSQPGEILFNVYKTNGDTERYALIHTGGDNWLYYNYTPTRETRPEIPTEKPHFKSIEPALIDTTNPNQYIAGKIDGAANVFVLRKNKPIEVYSYRPSKRGASKLIDHTFRTPLYTNTVPATLDKTVLFGEVFARKQNGEAAPLQTTAGILLSNVWKARDKQQQTPLDHIIYDVRRFKGRDVTQAPYAQKIQMLEQVQKELPALKMPFIAKTPADKQALINEITSGKHPLTQEGFIVYNLDQPVPMKSKFVQDYDVYLREVLPGKGRLASSMGRVGYSLTREGPIKGYVGGGFSDKLRQEIYSNPKKYIGLPMKIYAQAQLPSGAFRMPEFKEWRTAEKFPGSNNYTRSKIR